MFSRIAFYITETRVTKKIPNIKCGTTECVPNSNYPCCSPHGYCGITVAHCECEGCIDPRITTPTNSNFYFFFLK